jgi:hypothetical protein
MRCAAVTLKGGGGVDGNGKFFQERVPYLMTSNIRIIRYVVYLFEATTCMHTECLLYTYNETVKATHFHKCKKI